MGSRLAILAAVALASRTASAQSAAELMKKGVDLYKAGKYAEAASMLAKAYELDGKPETLFALAQAERLSGNCATAIEHYHKVIEQVSDFNVARLVQQNLALCAVTEPTPEKKPEPAPAPPPPPQVITKTVVREVSHSDRIAASLFGAGMLSVGAAGGLFLAASANRDAADKARTLDAHDQLASRASTEQGAMFVAAGLGAALIGVAVYRWTRGDETGAQVAVVPGAGGGTLWVSSHW